MVSNFSEWTPKSKTNIDKFMEEYNSHTLYNHDFSLGTLDSYFRLFEDLKTKKTFFAGSDNQILVMKRRRKSYVFDAESLTDSDLEYLHILQKNGVIYSPVKLPLPKENTFNELINDMSYVLDPTNYKNSKQRNYKLKRPFKWFNSNEIEITTEPKSIEEVEKLHTEWVGLKLEDPKVFKIFFPEKRYIYVFERLLNNPDNVDYKGIFFYGNFSGKKELISFRLISQEDNRGYDLTNISKYWLDPKISKYCNIVGLKYFYDNFGIDYFYCGRLTDEGHATFKKVYPHILQTGYIYGRIKEVIEIKKLGEYF